MLVFFTTEMTISNTNVIQLVKKDIREARLMDVKEKLQDFGSISFLSFKLENDRQTFHKSSYFSRCLHVFLSLFFSISICMHSVFVFV